MQAEQAERQQSQQGQGIGLPRERHTLMDTDTAEQV